jgi:hypothetical protein
MEAKKFIDYDKIIKVNFIPMHWAGYCWVEPTPEKRMFFGLILKEKADRGGWADRYSFINGYYTQEELLGEKDLMFVQDNIKDHQWQKRPVVKLGLTNGDSFSKYFDTNEAALEWADEVIGISNNNLQVL